jgi:hypothetical protein
VASPVSTYGNFLPQLAPPPPQKVQPFGVGAGSPTLFQKENHHEKMRTVFDLDVGWLGFRERQGNHSD